MYTKFYNSHDHHKVIICSCAFVFILCIYINVRYLFINGHVSKLHPRTIVFAFIQGTVTDLFSFYWCNMFKRFYIICAVVQNASWKKPNVRAGIKPCVEYKKMLWRGGRMYSVDCITIKAFNLHVSFMIKYKYKNVDSVFNRMYSLLTARISWVR